MTAQSREYRATWSDDEYTYDMATDTIPQDLLTQEQDAALDVARYRKRMHMAGLTALNSGMLRLATMKQLVKDENNMLWACRPEFMAFSNMCRPENPVKSARALGSLVIATATYGSPEKPCYVQADLQYFVPEEMAEAEGFMFQGQNCTWRRVVDGKDEGYFIADVLLFNTQS